MLLFGHDIFRNPVPARTKSAAGSSCSSTRAFSVTKLSAVNARGFSIWNTKCAAAPAAVPSLGAPPTWTAGEPARSFFCAGVRGIRRAAGHGRVWIGQENSDAINPPRLSIRATSSGGPP